VRIVFIEDDYARALAEARATHRPLFVDAWAPWCHTCISMRAYVFGDRGLQRLAPSFVWLAIDTEKAGNTAFVERFPMQVMPTLWVIDPADEHPALKWLGSATAQELAGLLEDAARAVDHGDAGGEAAAAFLRANQASAMGKREDAVRELRVALAAAPNGWAKRAQVVEVLAAAFDAGEDNAACVDLAADELPGMPLGTSAVNVAENGLACALRLPKDAHGRAKLPELVRQSLRIAQDPALRALADDRSSLYERIVEVLDDTGQADEAKRVARIWSTFLDGEAARAPTPTARMVFDPHRLEAYTEIGEAEKAVPMLTQSEQAFPDDYNPPARLARAYLELKRYDDAMKAVERALARVYGPRKLRVLSTKADIQVAKGDTAGAIATVHEALELARSLPLSARYAKTRDELEKRLSTLERKR